MRETTQKKARRVTCPLVDHAPAPEFTHDGETSSLITRCTKGPLQHTRVREVAGTKRRSDETLHQGREVLHRALNKTYVTSDQRVEARRLALGLSLSFDRRSEILIPLGAVYEGSRQRTDVRANPTERKEREKQEVAPN